MTPWADRPFQSLSYGQQRLLLVARALVKRPPLLVLDEPCQGLDPINRALVLEVIDRIASTKLTQILYITHEPEDRLDCVTHELRYEGEGWSIEKLA
jgi:molybdate transport system ATP-binding protein